MIAAGRYHFRPITAHDLPLLRTWLGAPHVRQWWGDPDRELAIIRDQIGLAGLAMYLICLDTRPIGYLQSYDCAGEPSGEWADQDPGAIGIDLFLGEAELVGHGHGRAVVRAFSDLLLTDAAVPYVLIDPAIDNHRAIRAYAAAGFEAAQIKETSEGLVQVMVRRRAA